MERTTGSSLALSLAGCAERVSGRGNASEAIDKARREGEVMRGDARERGDVLVAPQFEVKPAPAALQQWHGCIGFVLTNRSGKVPMSHVTKHDETYVYERPVMPCVLAWIVLLSTPLAAAVD